MKWSSEERQQFLSRLHGVERLVVGFYRVLLALIIVAIVVVAVLVVIWRPWGAGHQGEWFYFSVAVLLALGWAVGQFIHLGRRKQSRPPAMSFHSSSEENTQKWEFRIGSGANHSISDSDATPGSSQFSFSRSFGIPLASLATDVLPQESDLDCLEAQLAKGIDLDDACRMVQPAYGSWSTLQKKAYRMYVTARLDDRGNADDREVVPPSES